MTPRRARLSSLLILLLACLATGPVYADCTSPAGAERTIMYNADYHTYQFCNGSQWIGYGGAGGTGSLVLISTQTASSSASLQFTNLPTSYNTLFLNCSGLTGGTGVADFDVLVGEGAGPTWENGAHYSSIELYGSVATGSAQASGSNTWASLTGNNGLPAGDVVSIKLYIDNVGSSTIYKTIIYDYGYNRGGNHYTQHGSGYWNADKNLITGLEVYALGGAVGWSSGTCSLYGMN
jgi:hypothetical protein